MIIFLLRNKVQFLEMVFATAFCMLSMLNLKTWINSSYATIGFLVVNRNVKEKWNKNLLVLLNTGLFIVNLYNVVLQLLEDQSVTVLVFLYVFRTRRGANKKNKTM